MAFSAGQRDTKARLVKLDSIFDAPFDLIYTLMEIRFSGGGGAFRNVMKITL